MKIRMDVNDFIPPGKKINQPQKNIDSSGTTAATSDQKPIQNMSSRLLSDAALTDALAIAQASRALITKAMEISSRLRNIASEAMTTGAINKSEFNDVVSEIRGTMGEFDEPFVAPSTPLNLPSIPEVPSIEREITRVKDFASSMDMGKYPGVGDFTALDNQLAARSGDIAATETILEDKIRPLFHDLERNRPGVPDILRTTTERMAHNPESAIDLQGNINRETVSRIFS